MWLILALNFSDSVKYIYPRYHPTSMFFVAPREVVLVVHTTLYTAYTQCHAHAVTHNTPHGLRFGDMDDNGVKTLIDTFNHCTPPRKHFIIRSFT